MEANLLFSLLYLTFCILCNYYYKCNYIRMFTFRPGPLRLPRVVPKHVVMEGRRPLGEGGAHPPASHHHLKVRGVGKHGEGGGRGPLLA